MSGFQGTKINPTKFHRSQLKFYVVLVPLAVFMGLPIVYIFSTAFKPLDEMFAFPPQFFVRRPTMDNFKNIIGMMSGSNVPFSRYLFNSIASSLVVVVCTVLMCLCAGYVLSKKEFKGKKLLFAINTLALMFVAEAVKIPRYLVMEKAHLLNHFVSLVLPLIAMPVGLFLVKQFIDQMPDALIEAARIDGASDFRILFRIVAPIVKPSMVTVAILAFQTAWNTADAATLYVNSDSMKTFAFYMTALTTQNGNNVAGQGMSAAAALILFVPNLIIFICMQSKVLNTMAHSGIK